MRPNIRNGILATAVVSAIPDGQPSLRPGDSQNAMRFKET
jgi:hypothetical protein